MPAAKHPTTDTPPDSPRFNPTESAVAMLKVIPRRASERAAEVIRTTIGRIINTVMPAAYADYLAAEHDAA